jgi:hypothetical protein
MKIAEQKTHMQAEDRSSLCSPLAKSLYTKTKLTQFWELVTCKTCLTKKRKLSTLKNKKALFKAP